MKTLLLMRHAKSSWKEADLPDSERPVNKRGEKDAKRMGKQMKEKDLVPGLILSSNAERCRLTIKSVTEKSGFKGEIRYLDSLYLAEPPAYKDAINKLPEDADKVLVVGHNPGLEGLLQMVSGKLESLPTGSVACLQLPIERWADFGEEVKGELIDLWRPRDQK